MTWHTAPEPTHRSLTWHIAAELTDCSAANRLWLSWQIAVELRGCSWSDKLQLGWQSTLAKAVYGKIVDSAQLQCFVTYAENTHRSVLYQNAPIEMMSNIKSWLASMLDVAWSQMWSCDMSAQLNCNVSSHLLPVTWTTVCRLRCTMSVQPNYFVSAQLSCNFVSLAAVCGSGAVNSAAIWQLGWQLSCTLLALM